MISLEKIKKPKKFEDKSIKKNNSLINLRFNTKKNQLEDILPKILTNTDNEEKGIFQCLNIYEIFTFNKLNLLWKCWEIALLNLPLLIISDIPSICR